MREDEKARITNLLKRDELNEETRAAATRDLTLVLAEYFELCGAPKLTVEKGKDGVVVTFSAYASRVRNLSALPVRK